MRLDWDSLKPGCEPKTRTMLALTRTDVVRYQGASGDMNPIHHDEAFARGVGYDAPLVVGMLPAGILSTWATDWLGPANIRSYRVRWKQQVWPGDILSYSGRLVRKYTEADERKIDLELHCTKEDGTVAIQGWATFVVAAESA